MSKYHEPLEGLFQNSKKIVLDFTQISLNTPDYENFEKIFQDYLDEGLNPRAPDNRQRINNELIDRAGCRYLIGQYGEDRSKMLVDTPAGKEGRVIHMAIDVFAKDLEPVYSPCDGEIVVSGYEPGFGEYGNYVIIRPDDLGIFFFFGHLDQNRPALGRVSKGQEISRLGDYADCENGGWSRHLHIQILAELPPDGATPNGYSTKKEFIKNSKKYPNPLEYFPDWKPQ